MAQAVGFSTPTAVHHCGFGVLKGSEECMGLREVIARVCSLLLTTGLKGAASCGIYIANLCWSHRIDASVSATRQSLIKFWSELG